MNLTEGQSKALRKFTSGDNILIVGDPGTGKSTLVSAIVEEAKSAGKKVAITASTGIASQLIGGRTTHSLLKFFPGMDPTKIDYFSKAENLDDVDVLIIDEISMLGQKFIDYLYQCLAHAKKPVQLVLVGDFFQLPPVKDGYAFTSPSWELLNLAPCKLTEVVRQKDPEFIRNLNLLKCGDKRCLEYLLTHSSLTPLPRQISICAKREDAQHINRTELEKLPGSPQIYRAEYEGKVYKPDLRTEECLYVKKGMRVMSVINGHGYSNGSLGTVTDLDPESVEVMFDNGSVFRFKKVCFTAERVDIIGKTTDFCQIPLCPAHAITIHKSQGQTFRHVNIDGTKCWANGQFYVAVSRACSIEGIHFLTPIRERNIKTDPAVINFYKNLKF